MGWEAPREVLDKFNILFLRDQSEMPRNKIRLDITKDIFQKNNVPIFEVFGEGRSLLARIFSLIYIGDWVSYYLALLYEKDPLRIDSIQFLKESLSKFKNDVKA
jgi:glucose/mannose-6-phosphate isomerase